MWKGGGGISTQTTVTTTGKTHSVVGKGEQVLQYMYSREQYSSLGKNTVLQLSNSQIKTLSFAKSYGKRSSVL